MSGLKAWTRTFHGARQAKRATADKGSPWGTPRVGRMPAQAGHRRAQTRPVPWSQDAVRYQRLNKHPGRCRQHPIKANPAAVGVHPPHRPKKRSVKAEGMRHASCETKKGNTNDVDDASRRGQHPQQNGQLVSAHAMSSRSSEPLCIDAAHTWHHLKNQKLSIPTSDPEWVCCGVPKLARAVRRREMEAGHNGEGRWHHSLGISAVGLFDHINLADA